MSAGLREYRADLHIHTALSPCAEREMTPPAIVEAALKNELAMIAICDHNSASNTVAVERAAGGRLAVLHGLEITTAEEVHVLGLLPDAASAQEVAGRILATLPLARRSDERHFGPQWIMDCRGKVVAKEKSLLAARSTFDLSRVVKLVTNCGGLVIASHVDRPSFSVISQLGFFPEDVAFDAVELSPQGLRGGNGFATKGTKDTKVNDNSAVAGYLRDLYALGGSSCFLPVFTSSDSHLLGEVGLAGTVLRMGAATFEELRLVCRGAEGRGIVRRYCA